MTFAYDAKTTGRAYEDFFQRNQFGERSRILL